MIRRFTWLATILGSLLVGGAVARAAGELDTTFGDSGVFIDPLGEGTRPGASLTAVALQSDRKIVVVGSASNSTDVVARLGPDGALDTSFDGDGKLLDPLGAETGEAMNPEAIAIQDDGAIVIAGNIVNYGSQENRAAVVRLTPTGSLDATFSGDGIFSSQLGGGATPDSDFRTLTLLPDGTILLAGGATDADGSTEVLLARLDRDGTLDESFGDGGKKLIQLGDGASAASGAVDIALRPDGEIVVLGSATDSDAAQADATVLALIDADGQDLDPAFGTEGKLVTRFGLDDHSIHPNALALQGDGKLVVAGFAYDQMGAAFCLLARVNQAGGGVDADFSADGTFLQQIDEGPTSQMDLDDLVIQPDGKIVAVGFGTGSDGFGTLVLRLTSEGELDESFATGGILLTNLGEVSSGFEALSLDPNGSLVAVGNVRENVGENVDSHALVARVVTNLAPVASFTATPSSVAPDQTISFDASASEDPEGELDAYEWDFGDGESGAGATTTHSYASPGDFTASLTVRDAYGLSHTTTQVITVTGDEDSMNDGCGCRAGLGHSGGQRTFFATFFAAILVAFGLGRRLRRRPSRTP